MTDQIRDSNGHHEKFRHRFDDRSPEEIQRELDATRREMANTIHAIEEQLSSRQLMLRAIDFLRGGPLRFSQNLTETAVNNPVPVALIGVGLLWLARADSHGGGLRLTGETGERIQDKVSRAREAVGHTRERAHEIRERARDLRERSSERVRHSIGKARRAWHENPLMVGLVAAAAGAVLAAAIPSTRREREVIGPRRDRLLDEAKRTAQAAVEGAKSGVESAAKEVEVSPVDEPLTSDLYPEDVPPR